jgi:uncharacterized protein YndB with AHSA1/START domain
VIRTPLSPMSKTIRQTVTFRAAPKQVFEALMDAKKHAAFTHHPAAIDRKPGGSFTCYGGYISGFTLELVDAKRIVQAWRGASWPKGVYTIVTFTLAKSAGAKTRLTFTQAGVPANDVKAKTEGWKVHYWKPLKAYLEG